ncbi:hypothetical protein BGAL_0403g00090 [Botrytis galanthina]|uniref:Uncharacterized protein n=1 Tax=Botrytis galanthina TaxID=278940 RepID=A0A4S8QQ28_9HELO|nr:hypothetical protein BGAL_0403g00090 [Botrytis galanthina]
MKKKIADNFFSAIDNSSNLVNRYQAETVLNNKGIESFEAEVPNEGFVDVGEEGSDQIRCEANV